MTSAIVEIKSEQVAVQQQKGGSGSGGEGGREARGELRHLAPFSNPSPPSDSDDTIADTALWESDPDTSSHRSSLLPSCSRFVPSRHVTSSSPLLLPKLSTDGLQESRFCTQHRIDCPLDKQSHLILMCISSMTAGKLRQVPRLVSHDFERCE